MKQEHKKTFKGRLLAWVLTFAMLCTGMNVTAFAQDMSFDDGTVTEVQTEEPENYEADGTDEISSEVTEDQSTADETEITDETEIQEDQNEDALSDGKSQTDVFCDGAQEDQFSDTGATDESNTSVTVYFSVTDDEVYLSNTESLPGPVSLQKLTVPYFDLALYGLDNFYYSSENYGSGGTSEGTKETAEGKVTMLHLFIYATEVLYCGVDEADAGKGYLKNEGILGTSKLNITGSRGSMYMMEFWDMDQNLNYYKNYEYPLAGPGWGSTADQILLHDGDIVTLAHFSDWGFYSDPGAGFNYLKANGQMTQSVVTKGIDKDVTLEVYRTGQGDNYTTVQRKITGESALFYTPVKDLWDGRVSSWTELGITDADGNLTVDLDKIPAGEYFVGIDGQPGDSTDAICSAPGGIYLTVKEHECVWDEGKVTTEPTCTKPGEKTYTCTICQKTKTEEIPAAGHKFGKWKKISDATVFQPEKQQAVCSVCKEKKTRDYGKKLKATVKLNLTALTLQKKQSSKAVKVTMAKGDSVKSWTSGNREIASVDKNGVIKAGTKAGTAKITVTLKSGVKASLKVKVQSKKVTTTKISGLKSKLTLKKKQKVTLKPVISPVTSQDKVTYTSSNSKVATVSKNGVITGKKKGTAKITVKSGKKAYVIKVTVK